ncbi:MAG: hypothetical protein J0H98_00800 [Solirubrobacterales bacterium]|nr:hypothetical protein [Solirubrobacterales bacterium]
MSSKGGRFTAATAIVLALALGCAGSAAADGWTKPRPATPKGAVDMSAAVGGHGYAVIAYAMPLSRRPFVVKLFTRVKPAGRKDFGPPRLLGRSHSGWTNLEIGRRGLTLLSWSGLDDRLRVSKRNPRGGWAPPQVIRGGESSGAQLAIGRDGTAVLYDVIARSVRDPERRVMASVRDPRTGLFSDWRKISTDIERVGFKGAAVAGTKGRATVVFTPPCDGTARPSSWVDIGPGGATEPKLIPNSGCVAWDIDLQADDQGNQYLRLGLLTGVQLAIRGPGEDFGPATTVTAPTDSGDGGYLSVSRGGQATLLWGHTETQSTGRTSYLYVRSVNGSAPSPARRIPGVRLDRHKGRIDLLQDAAPLPQGRIAMIFEEVWEARDGDWKERVGTTVWRPGGPFRRPRYGSVQPKLTLVYPVEITTSHQGSQLAWWGREGDLHADALGYTWRGRFVR